MLRLFVCPLNSRYNCFVCLILHKQNSHLEKLRFFRPILIENRPPCSRHWRSIARETYQARRLAESCTGGLIASHITDVPGSSEYFLGSVVAYAYEAKEGVLHVPHELLLQHGAVSEPITRQLAKNARLTFGAEVAVGITGIMGPGGATVSKPLGLTYIALAADDADWCRRYVWGGNRLDNKRDSAHAALELLHEYLTR